MPHVLAIEIDKNTLPLLEPQDVRRIASEWAKTKYGFVPKIHLISQFVLDEMQIQLTGAKGKYCWLIVFQPVEILEHPILADPLCLLIDDSDGNVLG